MRPPRVVLYAWSNKVHAQRWARGLADRGLDIRMVSHGGEPLDDIDTVVIRPRSRMGKLSYVATAGEAARAAAEFKPDIVHGHFATGFGFWTWRTPVRPKVISVWGADVIDFPNDPIRHLLVRSILRGADAVTATSDFLARATRPFLTRGKEPAVIPFGVRLPSQIYNPLGDSVLRLCFLKPHRRKYGPDILLHALTEVHRRGYRAIVSLAGEGEFTAQLKQLAGELELGDAVSFTGFIDNSRIYDFIAGHHCMVMPSVMESESFGVAVLEAAACGRPCIASRIGGVPEVVRDGITGVMVPPGDIKALADAIVELAEDRDKCHRMGRAAYDFARENYSWDRSLDLMIDLYERLIREKNRD